jgi:hypothetical protein
LRGRLKVDLLLGRDQLNCGAHIKRLSRRADIVRASYVQLLLKNTRYLLVFTSPAQFSAPQAWRSARLEPFEVS